MCCCTTRTVRRALADLRALDMIQPNGKGRGGTIRHSVNANVLPTPDTSVHQGRTPTSYNPSNSNPSTADSNYFNAGSGWSGDSHTRRYRRTRQELIDEEQRERAAGRVLIAGNYRPKA